MPPGIYTLLRQQRRPTSTQKLSRSHLTCCLTSLTPTTKKWSDLPLACKQKCTHIPLASTRECEEQSMKSETKNKEWRRHEISKSNTKKPFVIEWLCTHVLFGFANRKPAVPEWSVENANGAIGIHVAGWPLIRKPAHCYTRYCSYAFGDTKKQVHRLSLKYQTDFRGAKGRGREKFWQMRQLTKLDSKKRRCLSWLPIAVLLWFLTSTN